MRCRTCPSRNNPVVETLVSTLRNPDTPRLAFRKTLQQIGEYLGLFIAPQFATEEREITTALGARARCHIIVEQPTLITILRAGLPLYEGLQRAFPESPAGFIGAMRNETTLKSEITYCALPDLEGKTVILADTMIATGGSIIDTLELLKTHQPKKIYALCAIASEPAMQRLRAYDPAMEVIAAAIDPELNAKGYIVPGLGDAGDRAYGRKT